MEKPDSYFDWQLQFRKTKIAHKTRDALQTNFNVMLKQFTEKKDLYKSVLLKEEDYHISKYATSRQAIKVIIHRLGKEPHFIFINLAEKLISHGCGRFKELNTENSPKFCKHLVKLFLILKEKEPDLALSILRHIYRHREGFSFC